MPVDRISRVDANMNRVQEAGDQGGRGQRDQEEEEEEKKKEKDKFDKSKPFWKKLLSDAADSTSRPNLAGGAKPHWNLSEREELTPAPPEDEFSDTGSVTEDISSIQSFLVTIGVLGLKRQPRWPVIVAYVLVLSVIVVSTSFIFGIAF